MRLLWWDLGVQLKDMIVTGDCLDWLRGLPDHYADAIVTDPPYGLGMDAWDRSLPSAEIWRECRRVLKPGAHLLAFGAPRTYHRLTVVIEDAGFEIRDFVVWLRGGGTPKTADLGKQDPAWAGFRSALRPAQEPICLARTPFKGPLLKNLQVHSTGALNIDACRIPRGCPGAPGRFPANALHDGSPEVLAQFPESPKRGSGPAPVRRSPTLETGSFFRGVPGSEGTLWHDEGSTARFFYCHTPGRKEIDDGLPEGVRNPHRTIKPTSLMAYLCRLVTPPGGLILDPFAGSGTTGRGALLEGFRFEGCEINPDYAEVARLRITAIQEKLCEN